MLIANHWAEYPRNGPRIKIKFPLNNISQKYSEEPYGAHNEMLDELLSDESGVQVLDEQIFLYEATKNQVHPNGTIANQFDLNFLQILLQRMQRMNI